MSEENSATFGNIDNDVFGHKKNGVKNYKRNWLITCIHFFFFREETTYVALEELISSINENDR